MKILIIGSNSNFQECKEKFGSHHNYILATDHKSGDKHLSDMEVVFDFTISNFPEQIKIYNPHPKIVAFLNTTLTSLQKLCIDPKLSSTFFGFCGLPTFLNRPILEVSVHSESDKVVLNDCCKKLSTEFVIVDDRVGLVTPRVICMIINEAYFTVEEGTASRSDIDLAMKLGTNYPHGPFEWSQKIGTRNVYDVLIALYDDTKDERYKICPLLRRECF